MCPKCKSWSDTYGCQDTNWITDKKTDPNKPVCGGLSFKGIKIVQGA